MAKGVNKVFLLGNVGRDPEVATTQGGTLVAKFSLATPDRRKDGRGEWQDHTEWHNCVAFGRTAEIIREYVRKGSRLHIEGKLQTRSWEDRDTQKNVHRTEIIIADLTLLSAKNDKTHPAYSDADDAAVSGAYSAEISDEDIPF